MMTKQLVQEIINLAGGQTALAEICGKPVTQSHVWNWLNRDKKIPSRYVLIIESMCSEKGRNDINRHVMAPHVFGELESTA